LFKGIFGLKVSQLEAANAEAVYEAAIGERVKKHRELKKAVARIIALRNGLQEDVQETEKELTEINAQIPIAVEEGEDEAALVLLQKKDQLQSKLVGHREDLTKVSAQAEESKTGLVAFRGEIENLKQEKVEMLAKKANAEARIKINETLDGLSTDADIKALESVRESIDSLASEADIEKELNEDSLDAKLAEIKKKTANASAQTQLDELKKQMAAKKQAQDTVKTI
jgi:phage shock protein A